MKRILAFAGSNSSVSINKRLVKHTLTHFSDFSSTLLDLNNYEMPIFSIDREKTGIPKLASDFLGLIDQSDILIISMAEHNRTYTVAFKNIFDWCSRVEIEIFKQKPMLLMSTSPGRAGGARVMETAKKHFPEFGARILATFSLPQFYQNFSDEEGITNSELRDSYLHTLTVFKHKLNKIFSGEDPDLD